MHAAAHRIDAPSTDDNRRQHGRVHCPQVTCRFAGQVRDMSASGLRLKLDRPSPVGPDAYLTLVLGSAAGSVEVKARVMWSRPTPHGHDLGLRFTDMTPVTRAALFNLAWTGPDSGGPQQSVRLVGSSTLATL